jgi:alpha-tubulin suppressor-like RCC1 family protein
VQVGVGYPDEFGTIRVWGADIDDPAKICANKFYTCGIDFDFKAVCFGWSGSEAPADLPPLEQIACGYVHVCALDTEGAIHCWGGDDHAGLPGSSLHNDSTIDSQTVPPGTYKEVSAGAFHTCAINTDDELVCWGAGSPMQGGDTDSFPNYGQSIPPSGKFRGLSAGDMHACAIKLDTGEVACWGAGRAGASDEPFVPGGTFCNPPNSISPVDPEYACDQAIPPAGRFEQVSSGTSHTCALDSGGAITCWGNGRSPPPQPACESYGFDCSQGVPPSGVEFVRVFSGAYTTCGLTADYVAHCWGWNFWNMATPPEDDRFSQITEGGFSHTCGIRAGGQLVCWGVNNFPATTVPLDFPGG